MAAIRINLFQRQVKDLSSRVQGKRAAELQLINEISILQKKFNIAPSNFLRNRLNTLTNTRGRVTNNRQRFERLLSTAQGNLNRAKRGQAQREKRSVKVTQKVTQKPIVGKKIVSRLERTQLVRRNGQVFAVLGRSFVARGKTKFERKQIFDEKKRVGSPKRKQKEKELKSQKQQKKEEQVKTALEKFSEKIIKDDIKLQNKGASDAERLKQARIARKELIRRAPKGTKALLTGVDIVIRGGDIGFGAVKGFTTGFGESIGQAVQKTAFLGAAAISNLKEGSFKSFFKELTKGEAAQVAASSLAVVKRSEISGKLEVNPEAIANIAAAAALAFLPVLVKARGRVVKGKPPKSGSKKALGEVGTVFVERGGKTSVVNAKGKVVNVAKSKGNVRLIRAEISKVAKSQRKALNSAKVKQVKKIPKKVLKKDIPKKPTIIIEKGSGKAVLITEKGKVIQIAKGGVNNKILTKKINKIKKLLKKEKAKKSKEKVKVAAKKEKTRVKTLKSKEKLSKKEVKAKARSQAELVKRAKKLRSKRKENLIQKIKRQRELRRLNRIKDKRVKESEKRRKKADKEADKKKKELAEFKRKKSTLELKILEKKRELVLRIKKSVSDRKQRQFNKKFIKESKALNKSIKEASKKIKKADKKAKKLEVKIKKKRSKAAKKGALIKELNKDLKIRQKIKRGIQRVDGKRKAILKSIEKQEKILKKKVVESKIKKAQKKIDKKAHRKLSKRAKRLRLKQKGSLLQRIKFKRELNRMNKVFNKLEKARKKFSKKVNKKELLKKKKELVEKIKQIKSEDKRLAGFKGKKSTIELKILEKAREFIIKRKELRARKDFSKKFDKQSKELHRAVVRTGKSGRKRLKKEALTKELNKDLKIRQKIAKGLKLVGKNISLKKGKIISRQRNIFDKVSRDIREIGTRKSRRRVRKIERKIQKEKSIKRIEQEILEINKLKIKRKSLLKKDKQISKAIKGIFKGKTKVKIIEKGRSKRIIRIKKAKIKKEELEFRRKQIRQTVEQIAKDIRAAPKKLKLITVVKSKIKTKGKVKVVVRPRSVSKLKFTTSGGSLASLSQVSKVKPKLDFKLGAVSSISTSLNPLKLIPIEKLTQTQKGILDETLKLSPKEDLTLTQERVLKETLKLIPKNKLNQKQREVLKETLVQLNKSKSRSKRKTKKKLKPKTPKIPIIPKLPKRRKKKKSKTQIGFLGQARGKGKKIGKRRFKKGKFLSIGKSTTKNRALRSAGIVANNTVSRSIRIIKGKKIAKRKDIKRPNVLSLFRKSKKEKGVLVERSKFAINTRGERRGITVKGLLARRRRRAKVKPKRARKTKKIVKRTIKKRKPKKRGFFDL